MIARVLFAWVAFSILLLLVALYSQGEPFELSHLGMAFALSVPVAVAVLRGGLGDSSEGGLRYPSVALMVVSIWTLAVGPSLVAESQDARYLYYYSDAALALARTFFIGWCLLFTVAAGRPQLKTLSARPHFLDLVACTLIALLLVTVLMRSGSFSNYQARDVRGLMPQAGSTESIAIVMGTSLFALLPPLLLLMMSRIRGRTSQALAVFAVFFASWALLFFLGSRTSLIVALAGCMLICRGLGMRLRAKVLVGLAAALPTVLVLILVYRSALSSTQSESITVGQLFSVASDATRSLNEQEGQYDALNMVENNARVRLWYAQQFCVLIDLWLDEGAALRGTLFSNVIGALPTALMSNKNELATALNFELAILETHRYPEIDLAPMPWMQWLYELGLLGLVIGPLIYAWLARVIERRMSKTGSLYEILFWLGLFAAMLPPEHTTDSLVLNARSVLVHALVLSGAALALTWFSSLGRSERTA